MENLKRIYSLGYEGSSPHIIRSILIENKITHLIDIRPKNHYHNSPFNKHSLSELCQELEVTYIHEPILSPTSALLREERQRIKAIRERFSGRDKATRLKKFNALLNNAEFEFKTHYLMELDQRKVCKIFSDFVHQTEQACFFSKKKFNHLAISNRKILIDHCLLKCKLKKNSSTFVNGSTIRDSTMTFERLSSVSIKSSSIISSNDRKWLFHGIAVFLEGKKDSPSVNFEHRISS